MKIKDRVVELRRVKASELSPHPQNWRQHPEKQQNALRAALADIGYADALKVRQHNGGYQILDGHLRAETTPDMEVPVLVLDLDDGESKKLLATFDPLAGMAEANQDMLKGLLTEIELPDDLGAALDGLIDDKPEVKQDEVPEVQDEAVATTGDSWKCGDHLVICENAADQYHENRRCGLCFTSPPYMDQREYGGLETGWDELMESVFANLPMDDGGQVLVNLGLVHRDNEWVPYWDKWIEYMRIKGWRRFGWYVWDQGSGLPGDWSGRLAPSHEFIFHFNKTAVRPAKHVDTKPEYQKKKPAGSKSMRRRDGTVGTIHSPDKTGQRHKIPDSILRITREMGNGIARQNHPAIFPVSLAEFVIRSWSGDVYDPFLGSGTTLIAAHQLNRRCYGIEIEPRYVDVTLKRYLNLTGDSPIRESDGAKFTDLLDV